MAEEDEIDILGDFENYLSKTNASIYTPSTLMSENTELLDCNYTVHPQWLLDRPSTNPDSWYESTSGVLSPQPSAKEQELPVGNSIVRDSITDESGWTEKEKSLLQRGIEIFDKNEGNLSQFIGSKSPNEVKYYLDKFYLESQSSGTYCNGVSITESDDSGVMTEVLTDIEIPTSIEEVIDTISTGKPTITVPQKTKKSVSFSNSQSSVKCNPTVESQTKEPKPTSLQLKKLRKTPTLLDKWRSRNSNGQNIPKKYTKFKFKAQMNLSKANINVIPIKQKTVNYLKEIEKAHETGKIELTTGRGLSVPLCEGEEIVKLKKENSDSDSDIDLEIDVEDTDLQKPVASEKQFDKISNSQNPICDNAPNKSVTPTSSLEGNETCIDNNEINMSILDMDLSAIGDETLEQLMSTEEPKEEYCIAFGSITEIEKAFHAEFFDFYGTKKGPKTPERYLKIRDFILSSWKMNKPSYITKTSLRQGLRNCGDVNCIGRIHAFLEQIGAINFGCAQVTYIRPLCEVLKSFNKEKKAKELKAVEQVASYSGPRQRFKKKFTTNGDGGCTLTHDEKGYVIDATIVDEKPVVKKPYIKKPTINLITCRPFSKDMPQRFRVVLRLSALLPMDYHAHTSLSEVMGLVAGYWDAGRQLLTVCRYEPCRSVASSATHCEMCPVSQAQAAEAARARGLRVLGWFHSHPTFAPEPSQQDLDTQLSLQHNLGGGDGGPPCVGVILSPFADATASRFRCLVVDRKRNFEDQLVPYRLYVEQRAGGCDVDHLLAELRRVREVSTADSAGQKDRLDFSRGFPTGDANNTLLDRFIGSLKAHLSKFEDINGKTSAQILTEVYNMLKK